MSFNRITCPITTDMRTALDAADRISIVARIRPTWTNEHERFSFGAFASDPSYPDTAPGFALDCQSNRTFDGIYNAIGGHWRYGTDSFDGAAALPSIVVADWTWIAATIDLSTNPQVLRLFDRASTTDPWNLLRLWESDPGPSTLFLRPEADALYAGNRFTNFAGQGPTDETWPGGIAKVSLSLGLDASGEPGGTEIAEWHATPPHNTYTDPYGNVWSITGDTWQYAAVT